MPLPPKALMELKTSTTGPWQTEPYFRPSPRRKKTRSS